MLRIGLTGGIGSGKTTVARIFASLGIPVYDSDYNAKRLMAEDPVIRQRITGILGEHSYNGKEPDTKYIAGIVFSQPEILRELNAIVHPAVGEDFVNWARDKESEGNPYAVMESAILFESGFSAMTDITVTVSACDEMRIKRVSARDGISPEKVRERISNQMDDRERILLSDHVIYNDVTRPVVGQVLALDELFRNENTI